jgi:lysophospholipase L1-like esterase
MSRFARPALLACALAGAVACALAAAVASPAAQTSRTVLQFGDSLAVGTGVFLPAALRGWSIDTSAAISRHADDGPPGLRSLGAALPHVLVISLGTNDDPGAFSRFARAVRDVVRIAGPRRCVIWSTIVRPPFAGVSYDGYNRALRRIAASHETLHVFDWQALARSNPQWFGLDGVHPNADGYRERAAELARLVRSCP